MSSRTIYNHEQLRRALEAMIQVEPAAGDPHTCTVCLRTYAAVIELTRHTQNGPAPNAAEAAESARILFINEIADRIDGHCRYDQLYERPKPNS